MNSTAQICARLLLADLSLTLVLALSLRGLADVGKRGLDHLLPALLVRGRGRPRRRLVGRGSSASSTWVLLRRGRLLGLIRWQERLGLRGLVLRPSDWTRKRTWRVGWTDDPEQILETRRRLSAPSFGVSFFGGNLSIGSRWAVSQPPRDFLVVFTRQHASNSAGVT
jgi:hypothetical protein